MKLHLQTLRTSLLVVLPVLAACDASESEPAGPDVGGVAAELFDRYAAVGNSITAGFQSGGINSGTQLEAYPVLLAGAAGASFQAPLLAMPGCPPPFASPLLAGSRTGNGGITCALREDAIGQQVQNLAVPGAKIRDLFENPAPSAEGGAGVLAALFLGGRTQAEALVELQPTLVTAWIGNNDVLGAARTGDPALLTPLASFTTSLDGLVAAIKQTPAREDAVLIGIAPFVALLQPGAYFWALRGTAQLPIAVNDNCGPLLANGQPNPLGANLVSFAALAALQSGQVAEIDCSNDAPFLLNPAELQIVYERMGQYNAAIEAAALANDWLYVDVIEVLAGASATIPAFRSLLEPARFKLCQGLSPAASPGAFAAAVAATCPAPTAVGGFDEFFGSFLSVDAIHPNGAFHRFFANALVQRLNARYDLSIPPVG